MGKTALILTGGGMKCSYSAGALIALEKEFGFRSPDIVIAGSGGAGIASYYLAGQYDLIRPMWEEIAPSKRLLDPLGPLKGRRILDIDYLVDDIMQKQHPLNISRVKESGADYLISATNAKNGKVEFFNTSSEPGLYEMVRATMAMPVAYGKTVKIGEGRYFDTFNSSLGINGKIDKAMELGAERVIVLASVAVDHNYHGYVVPSGLRSFYLFSLFKGRGFRENYYSELAVDMAGHKRENVDIFILKPSPGTYIGDLENDSSVIKNMIDKGFKETVNNREFLSFLENKK
jgi:predicted patatin/cPLA2 family phospholipase